MKLRIIDRNPGDGRGRAMAGKRVILVSQAHPGELVTVRVDKKTSAALQGRVAQLLEAAPDRIAHPCPHAFRCTGCVHLALAPETERTLKYDALAKLLRAIGPDLETRLEPVTTPAGPFYYRHLAKQIFTRQRGAVVLGSYVQGTHAIVDNHDCPVLAPPLAALMRRLAAVAGATTVVHDDSIGARGLRYAVARLSAATGEMLLTLVTSADDAATCRALGAELLRHQRALVGVHIVHNDDPGNALLGDATIVAAIGADSIEDELLGFRHRIGPTSFFQINPHAAQTLFRAALDMAGRGDVCVEAYAGVGALTLPLAQRFARVVAIENAPASVEQLRRAAANARAGRIEAIEGDVETRLPELLRETAATTVVLDPPRRGLGAAAHALAVATSVRRVVLLSCDPRSLTIDLPPLLAAGFALRRIVPVDQFPRTPHVETVTLLERGGA